MHTRTLSHLLLAALVLGAIGCGRGGRNDPPSASATYDDFVKDITDTTCERVFQCPEKAPALVFYLGRFENESECKIVLNEASKADESTDQIRIAVEQGRIEYNGDQAEECLQALSAELGGARCAANFDTDDIPACDSVFVGKVAAGGDCAITAECANGLFCEAVSSQACGGRCQALSAEGEGCGSNAAPCDDDTTCLIPEGQGTGMCVADHSIANNEYCSATAQCDRNSICAGNRCRAKQDANVVMENDNCDLDLSDICQPGLVCTDLNLIFQQGTCKPPGGQGAPCYILSECAAGFTCRDATVFNRGSCEPVGMEGDECSDDFNCASFVCRDGECASNEVCELSP